MLHMSQSTRLEQIVGALGLDGVLDFIKARPILTAAAIGLVAVTAALFACSFNVAGMAVSMGLIGLGSVVGELREDTTPEEHLVRDVSDALTYMDEAAQVPLDQMLRRMRRRKPAENVIIEWERVDRTPPRLDTVSAATTGHSAGAKITVDVNNVGMWRPNDLIHLPDQSDPPLLLVVSTDNAADTIDVYALPVSSTKTRTAQSFGTVPDLALDENLTRIAPSKTESDTPSDSRMTTPVQAFNYVHTFDARVQASDHRQRTKNYSMDDWQRGRADSVIDLRRSMEYNYFFGKPSVTTGENGKLRWTMGGILHYVSQTLNYTTGSLDEATIVDWHTEIYTGNTGRKNRVLFADKELAGDIDKVMLAKMQHVPTRNVAGVMATELRTRHGSTLVVHHPGFDELNKANFGVVVDLAYVSKCELQPMETRELKLKESGQEDADAEQYIEKSTLEVTNPEVHYIVEGS
jgi:hypothetical protein